MGIRNIEDLIIKDEPRPSKQNKYEFDEKRINEHAKELRVPEPRKRPQRRAKK